MKSFTYLHFIPFKYPSQAFRNLFWLLLRWFLHCPLTPSSIQVVQLVVCWLQQWLPFLMFCLEPKLSNLLIAVWWLVLHPAVVSALTIIAAYGNLILFNVIRAIPVYNISSSLIRVILLGTNSLRLRVRMQEFERVREIIPSITFMI